MCGGRSSRRAFRSRTEPIRQIGAADLSPSASAFGSTVGEVVRCTSCGHGSLRTAPTSALLDSAYAHVADESSVHEEEGQLATSRRDLADIAARIGPCRGRLLDVGCWTGSLLGAAAELGWQAQGIDPSAWAVARASERGHQAERAVLDDPRLEPGSFQVVTCCDVLEHLPDPAASAARLFELVEPGGYLFVAVPDSGSIIARLLGRRWWSVLPMHVQYFTRESATDLLRTAGFEIESVRTHPKIFSRRYYGDRLGEFLPVIGPAVARFVARSSGAELSIGPDFRDRLAIVGHRPPRQGDQP